MRIGGSLWPAKKSSTISRMISARSPPRSASTCTSLPTERPRLGAALLARVRSRSLYSAPRPDAVLLQHFGHQIEGLDDRSQRPRAVLQKLGADAMLLRIGRAQASAEAVLDVEGVRHGWVPARMFGALLIGPETRKMTSKRQADAQYSCLLRR